MSLALVILAALAYLFIGGLIGQAIYATRSRRCGACKQGRGYPYNCDNFHGFSAALAGIVWPVTIPAIAGALAAWWIGSHDSRAERKAGREKVRHEQRLAELAAEKERDAAIEFLERNGIHARVDFSGAA